MQNGYSCEIDNIVPRRVGNRILPEMKVKNGISYIWHFMIALPFIQINITAVSLSLFSILRHYTEWYFLEPTRLFTYQRHWLSFLAFLRLFRPLCFLNFFVSPSVCLLFFGFTCLFSPFPSFTVSLTFRCFVSLYSFPRLHSAFYLLLLDFLPPSYYFPHLSFPVSLLSLYLVFVSPHFPRAVFAFSCSLFNSTKPIRSPFRTNSRKSW